MVRSQTRREWGLSLDETNATQCVRRFGLPAEGTRTNDLQVTACKLSESNGRDLLVTYSQEDVYLFDLLSEPKAKPSAPVAPKRKRSSSSAEPSRVVEARPSAPSERPVDPDPNRTVSFAVSINDDGQVEVEAAEEPTASESAPSTSDDNEVADAAEPVYRTVASRLQAIRDRKHAIDGDAPVVHPVRRFAGHRNVDTVKDVNFGFGDALVLSGSDDGRLFAWAKATGKLVGCWDGDGSVVNVRAPSSIWLIE